MTRILWARNTDDRCSSVESWFAIDTSTVPARVIGEVWGAYNKFTVLDRFCEPVGGKHKTLEQAQKALEGKLGMRQEELL